MLNSGSTIPVVYNVSLKEPGGYFLATRVQMHNNKVLDFADKAKSVEITKFLAFAQNAIATVNEVAATGNSIETWSIESHIARPTVTPQVPL